MVYFHKRPSVLIDYQSSFGVRTRSGFGFQTLTTGVSITVEDIRTYIVFHFVVLDDAHFVECIFAITDNKNFSVRESIFRFDIEREARRANAIIALTIRKSHIRFHDNSIAGRRNIKIYEASAASKPGSFKNKRHGIRARFHVSYRRNRIVSETVYEGKGVAITKTQSSYVTPGDERLSSLPVNATVFTLENNTKETREVTIVQIQDSITGYMAKKDRQGVQDSSFVLVPSARFPKGVQFDKELEDGRSVRGIEFYNEKALVESDFNGCMGVSVAWNKKDNLNVSVKPMFYQDDAKAVLKAALQSGRVANSWVKNVYSGRETIAGAIAVTAVLKPKQKVSFQFNMVLDFPEIKLNKLTSAKKYTAFYPEAYGRVVALLTEALAADKTFDARLKAFENLVPKKPVAKLYKTAAKQAEFKSLAINTLSFLAEATVWDKEDRFLVRECADYPFFNSLDVYFYGSFSL